MGSRVLVATVKDALYPAIPTGETAADLRRFRPIRAKRCDTVARRIRRWRSGDTTAPPKLRKSGCLATVAGRFANIAPKLLAATRRLRAVYAAKA
jgi:hypothetical protein